MIVRKFISFLTILQLIRLNQLVPIELESELLTTDKVVPLPKGLRRDERIPIKASESVCDRLRLPDRYLFIDKESDPSIAIGNSVDIDSDCNSKEEVPRQQDANESPSPDTSFDNSALFEWLQIILQLIAKSEVPSFVHFANSMWRSIENCRTCDSAIDQLQFRTLMVKLRKTLPKRIEFTEDLFRQWNCHQMLMDRRSAFGGHNGHRRWIKGGYKYSEYEPSLWPKLRLDRRIEGETRLQGRAENGDRRRGKNYLPLDVHTSTIAPVNKTPGKYQTTTITPPSVTPTTTPPIQSKESSENKTTTESPPPTTEEITTTTTVFKTTQKTTKAPLFDDSMPLLKSGSVGLGRPKATKKPQPFLWYTGRDLSEYEESRRNTLGDDHQEYDHHFEDEHRIRWKDLESEEVYQQI